MAIQTPGLFWEKDLSNELLSAIGFLIASGASAESAVAFEIARIVNLPHHPQPVSPFQLMAISGMEFRAKTSFLATLVKYLGISPKLKKTIAKCCDQLSSAMKPRNDIAHGIAALGRSQLEIKILSFKPSPKSQDETQYKTAVQIREDAEKIHQLTHHLLGLMNQTGIPQPTGFGTQAPPGK